MKIALPTRNGMIDSHFGHCEKYTVFTTDGKEIISQETVPSPVGCGCKSNIATTLSAQNVSLMLAGNMGDGAVNVLKNAGIQVVRGCEGNITDVVTSWLNGSLADSGETCSAHEDGHECSH